MQLWLVLQFELLLQLEMAFELIVQFGRVFLNVFGSQVYSLASLFCLGTAALEFCAGFGNFVLAAWFWLLVLKCYAGCDFWGLASLGTVRQYLLQFV